MGFIPQYRAAPPLKPIIQVNIQPWRSSVIGIYRRRWTTPKGKCQPHICICPKFTMGTQAKSSAASTTIPLFLARQPRKNPEGRPLRRLLILCPYRKPFSNRRPASTPTGLSEAKTLFTIPRPFIPAFLPTLTLCLRLPALRKRQSFLLVL